MGAHTWLVVCCYNCKKFQVDQEKKSKRWKCKVCGEAQSLQRIYARSHSAKDCRLVVQQYNTARGAAEAEAEEQAVEEAYAAAEDEEAYGYGGHGYGLEEEEGYLEAGEEGPQALQQQGQGQRWLAYADEEEEGEGWTVAVPERATKQKRGCSGHSSGAGGKRRRQQQHLQLREEEQAEPEYGDSAVAAATGAAAVWQTTEQQPHWGAQQRPLSDQNGQAGRVGQGHSWQQACGQQWHRQQPQPQQHPAMQQPKQQCDTRWQSQQGQQPAHQPAKLQQHQAQPPAQQQPAYQQQLPQQRWGPGVGRQQLPAAQPQAAAAPAACRWTSFVEADDW